MGAIMALPTWVRSRLTERRLARHAPYVGLALPPDDALVLDAPGERLASAAAGLPEGDFKPVAELLAWTREHAHWETRDRLVRWLAGNALDAAAPVPAPGVPPAGLGAWLGAWLEAAPESPDAALLRAEAALRHTWRGPTPAERLSRLRAAEPLLAAATEAGPPDPVPWRLALTRARAVRAPRPVFDTLWEEATARAPHHYGCHTAALRYLCAAAADGRAAPGEYAAFADRAARRALPGSLLRALPLLAAYEHTVGAAAPDPRLAEEAIERARELSGWYEPGALRLAQPRNVLALLLVARARWPEALDAFEAIGAHVTAFPWSRLGADPLREFRELRAGVRYQLAAGIPLRARPGGRYAR
jgi:hypothetical protein